MFRHLQCKKRPVFTLYIVHLTLLSLLNSACLIISTLESGMGLWIFGNNNNGTAHWAPNPNNGRETWAILSSCIITLILSVCTSLHLNIEAHMSSTMNSFLLKAKYVIAGLLAPEMMVFNAWRQRTVASSIVARLRKDRGGKQPIPFFRRLLNGLNKAPRKMHQGIKKLLQRLGRQQPKNEHQNGLPHFADKDPWAEVTLVHGFYIVMGGYVFDISKDPKPRRWPSKVDRLTPGSIAVLGCLISQDKDLREVLRFLSEEEIWDKSKANGLAKAIVCIQASWFCAQCVGRLRQRIPVSLLEFSTFAHAICALLVYLLWWGGPLDVHEPTVIDVGQSAAARYICALAWSGAQTPVTHLQRVGPTDGRTWKRIVERLSQIIGRSTRCHLGDGPLTGLNSDQGSTPRYRPCAQIRGLERPSALEHCPAQFEGLDPAQNKLLVWASSDPRCSLLREQSLFQLLLFSYLKSGARLTWMKYC